MSCVAGPAARGPGLRTRLLGLSALAALLAAGAAASPLSAQEGARRVDAGRFRILQDGRPVATEVFAIRRESSSLRSVARLTVESDTALLGNRITEARLQTNPGYEPVLFELEVRRGGDLSLVGARSGSRFRLRTRSPAGERWKEFLVPDGLVILPDGFVHFHHFIFRQRQEGVELTALLPGEGVERPVRTQNGQADTVRAAGRRVPSTRWEVMVGGERRLIWRAEDGRILRVEIPAERWAAVRAEGGGPSGSLDGGRGSDRSADRRGHDR